MEEKTLTFEQAMDKLETIVERLEAGEDSLDHSIALFEEGAKLSACCYQTLKNAEQKINRITGKGEETDVQ